MRHDEAQHLGYFDGDTRLTRGLVRYRHERWIEHAVDVVAHEDCALHGQVEAEEVDANYGRVEHRAKDDVIALPNRRLTEQIGEHPGTAIEDEAPFLQVKTQADARPSRRPQDDG